MVPNSNQNSNLFFENGTSKKIKARMAEWSKALDLRPNIVKMRGFEPLFVQLAPIIRVFLLQ